MTATTRRPRAERAEAEERERETAEAQAREREEAEARERETAEAQAREREAAEARAREGDGAADGGGVDDDILDAIAPAGGVSRSRGGRPRRVASTLGYGTTTAVKLLLAEPEAEALKQLGLKSRTGNTRKLAGADIGAAFVRVAMKLCDGRVDLHGVQPGDDAELADRILQALTAAVLDRSGATVEQ